MLSHIVLYSAVFFIKRYRIQRHYGKPSIGIQKEVMLMIICFDSVKTLELRITIYHVHNKMQLFSASRRISPYGVW